jgi:hypothetical protein
MNTVKPREVRVVIFWYHKHYTIAIPHDEPLKPHDVPQPDLKNKSNAALLAARKLLVPKIYIFDKLRQNFLDPPLYIHVGCPNQRTSKCVGKMCNDHSTEKTCNGHRAARRKVQTYCSPDNLHLLKIEDMSRRCTGCRPCRPDKPPNILKGASTFRFFHQCCQVQQILKCHTCGVHAFSRPPPPPTELTYNNPVTRRRMSWSTSTTTTCTEYGIPTTVLPGAVWPTPCHR